MRVVVTNKVDNSEDGQGLLGQGKADEKGVGLLRAVQGKTSSLLRVVQCKLRYQVYILVRYDSRLIKDCSIPFHTILPQSLQGEGMIHAQSMC